MFPGMQVRGDITGGRSWDMKDTVNNILLSGVGGQGILTASNLICEVLLHEGFDVKKNEIHGMSQRGGSVTSHIRYGEKVFSPVIPHGEADYLVGFELLEGYRYIDTLREKGQFIYNNYSIVPGSMLLGRESIYPDNLEEKISASGYKYYSLPAEEMARELGNTRVVNTILVGFLARFLNINKDVWLEAIERIVKKKYANLNLKAFETGYSYDPE